MSAHRPPGLARRILGRLVGERDREHVLGDMDELYALKGGRPARRWLWYWWHVAQFAWRLALARTRPGNGSARRLESVVRDVRYAARTLLRAPGYSLLVVWALALGIGANIAVFALLDSVLFQPLPYADGDRIVVLNQRSSEDDFDVGLGFSVPEIEEVREALGTVTRVAEYHSMTFTARLRDEVRLIAAGVVSADFFDLLGMEPALGREFLPADDVSGAAPVVVLSWPFWREAFDGDPSVVGESMEMNDRRYRIVGVLPDVPQHPRVNDVYLPTVACPTRSDLGFIADRRARMMTVFGRLLPGRRIDETRAELRGVMDGLAEAHPDAYRAPGLSFEARYLEDELTERARPVFLLLAGTVGLVLLLACANVANLALARTVRRDRELSIRAALGAGKGRLAQQLFAEHFVLAGLAGVLGLALAATSLDLMGDFAARFTPRADDVAIRSTTLLFTLGVVGLTGALFGWAPAWIGTGADTVGAGRQRSLAPGPGRARRRIQSALVVTQVAGAFLLVAGAGLLLRSQWSLGSVDLGFGPGAESVVGMDLVVHHGSEAAHEDAFRRTILAARDALSKTPGVVAAGIVSRLPLSPMGGGAMEVHVEPDGAVGAARGVVGHRIADGGFFQATGLAAVRGRVFGPGDTIGADPVVVVTEALAERYFDGNAVGGRMRVCGFQGCSPEATLWRIVGVVPDTRHESLEEGPHPAVYHPSTQWGYPGATLIVRAEGDAIARVSEFLDVIRGVEADVGLSSVSTIERYRDEHLAPRRVALALLTGLAIAALLVSLAGLAGLVAFTVGERRREWGIRLAVGAPPGRIHREVVGTGAVLLCAGVVLGLVVTVPLTPLLRPFLWGVGPHDPTTLVFAALCLAGGGLLACWAPARRATRDDPLRALDGA